MRYSFLNSRGWTGSAVLLLAIAVTGGGLAAWKHSSNKSAEAAAASQPEPMESVTTAIARDRQYRPSTTSIGTVLALNSITLRNEIAGTVRRVSLVSGDLVDAGTVLVALDVSVEEAELAAQKAQADLAETTLARLERLRQAQATSQEEVDQAHAARDVALAQMERTRAIIARKTIRAPFRARVGIADVHIGQYLNEGTELTTLQGVDAASNVDFTVAQVVAAGLRDGQTVAVFPAGDSTPIAARIVAIDSRVDPATRNAMVRARIPNHSPSPGASVRVEVPVGAPGTVVSIPVSGLRKGPGGDLVFLIVADSAGKLRAHMQPVQSGPVIEDEVVILNGLKPGDQVATSGSFKLREGVLVAVASDSTR
ncbi:MAG TPA: efflux RND transporter periplasmic adaptor subunit [Gemmatimonadales bacterium]|jgi:membrane fusion protein (multidrug efflux system)|nr:efflux RND transporter periplasmic adaptor subunit [Gemmatimonadales bacterium]